MADPIRLAIIGAGIYAHSTHLPALQKLRNRFEVVAVYSRTQEKAEALARQFSAQATTDLDTVLNRKDIDAFDILLPIQVMPTVVEAALRTGKHVISEKPIAPDLETGRHLLAIHRPNPDQVWMVGEQWRYEDAFMQAQAMIGDIGDIIMAQCATFNALNPDNRYYHTPWRRSGEFPGGPILDGGVHRVAALRMLVGEVQEVSAVVKQIRADLPPADTMTATLEFENGAVGSFSATYAAGTWMKSPIVIVGTKAILRVSREILEINGSEIPITGFLGTERQFVAFADAIQLGQSHLNSPEEAWRDLAVIEAILESDSRKQPILVREL